MVGRRVVAALAGVGGVGFAFNGWGTPVIRG